VKASSDDLFVDPPTPDPAFAEFSPAVVDHRFEPFVGQELATHVAAPLDSWRHMVGSFALSTLSSAQLLGIVAHSRCEELRARYLTLAAPVQQGLSANAFFDQRTGGAATANTVVFSLPDGSTRAFVWVKDDGDPRPRGAHPPVDGETAPVTLLGVLVDELTHVRNRANEESLRTIPDTDGGTYADTALAQARSATGTPTSEVLRSFIAEMCARHVHWVVLQAGDGNR
jgi:hypothetical protein